MANLARRTALGRDSLYKALSNDGNPDFRTVLGVAAAFRYRFIVRVDNRHISRKKSLAAVTRG
jgi:probable addiction module antidote protein